ncbi:MAG: hypothetical protein AAFV45_11440 [Pseudomonadota bacterium]
MTADPQAPDKGTDEKAHGFQTPEHEKTWLDEPRTIDTLIYGLSAVCALLVVIDPFLGRHGKFEIETLWGFYAFCGFVGCVGVVLIAKLLRTVVKQPEDYYDE